MVIRQKAEEVEQAALSVERAALGRDTHATGVVRLTASDDIAANLIAPHLGRFHARYPDITLEIVAQMELADLTRREADIALRGARPTRGHFVVRRAGVWHFGLYAARKYADAHNLKPGVSDLSEAEIITWTNEWAHLRGGPWFAEHAAARSRFYLGFEACPPCRLQGRARRCNVAMRLGRQGAGIDLSVAPEKGALFAALACGAPGSGKDHAGAGGHGVLIRNSIKAWSIAAVGSDGNQAQCPVWGHFRPMHLRAKSARCPVLPQ